MSELKVIKIELNNHGKPIASIQGTTSYYGISKNDMFYSKSEADEVIAELKETLNNSRNARKYWRKEYLIEYKECRYQKYKRCLAMATACHEQVKHYKVEYDADEGFGDNWLKWIRWAKKWKTRWLNLAEKFKEAK